MYNPENQIPIKSSIDAFYVLSTKSQKNKIKREDPSVICSIPYLKPVVALDLLTTDDNNPYYHVDAIVDTGAVVSLLKLCYPDKMKKEIKEVKDGELFWKKLQEISKIRYKKYLGWSRFSAASGDAIYSPLAFLECKLNGNEGKVINWRLVCGLSLISWNKNKWELYEMLLSLNGLLSEGIIQFKNNKSKYLNLPFDKLEINGNGKHSIYT